MRARPIMAHTPYTQVRIRHKYKKKNAEYALYRTIFWRDITLVIVQAGRQAGTQVRQPAMATRKHLLLEGAVREGERLERLGNLGSLGSLGSLGNLRSCP